MSTFPLARTAVCALALSAASFCVQANYDWAFSYSGDGVDASGTFQTLGPATAFEEIVSIDGERNGVAIDGIVPLNTDPFYIYDN